MQVIQLLTHFLTLAQDALQRLGYLQPLPLNVVLDRAFKGIGQQITGSNVVRLLGGIQFSTILL